LRAGFEFGAMDRLVVGGSKRERCAIATQRQPILEQIEETTSLDNFAIM